jgi:hypothetical protein
MNALLGKIMLLGASVLLVLCVLPPTAVAGAVDGSRPILLAALTVQECLPEGDCARVAAREIDLPRFFRIDIPGRRITASVEGGQTRVTEINAVAELDDRLILSGVQRGMGWTLVLNKTTGEGILTASGLDVGFVVFGACTQLE